MCGESQWQLGGDTCVSKARTSRRQSGRERGDTALVGMTGARRGSARHGQGEFGVTEALRHRHAALATHPHVKGQPPRDAGARWSPPEPARPRAEREARSGRGKARPKMMARHRFNAMIIIKSPPGRLSGAVKLAAPLMAPITVGVEGDGGAIGAAAVTTARCWCGLRGNAPTATTFPHPGTSGTGQGR